LASTGAHEINLNDPLPKTAMSNHSA